MKRTLFSVLLVAVTLFPTSALAQEEATVTKTYCTSASGYVDVDAMKADLLANAKREVVNEIFGELIASTTAVDDMVVTSDQIRASSIGFVRTGGDANFYNGADFAEICVTVEGYVTAADLALFDPLVLTKRNCVTDPDMTTSRLTTFARQEAIVQALYDYDHSLMVLDRSDILDLMQRVEYLESGFITDTETYCVQVQGAIIPIEIRALMETNGDSSDWWSRIQERNSWFEQRSTTGASE